MLPGQCTPRPRSPAAHWRSPTQPPAYAACAVQGLVTAMYNEIREEAKRDVAHWGNPGDPDRGYQQLMREQLPIRRQQLYEQYGPGGAVPLIPGALGEKVALAPGQASTPENHPVDGCPHQPPPPSPPPPPPCCCRGADAQPGSFQLALGQVLPGPSGFVEVSNPNAFDADVGGYRLQGAVQMTFAPGEACQAGGGQPLPASLNPCLPRLTDCLLADRPPS
jgi:hypothetical protein